MNLPENAAARLDTFGDWAALCIEVPALRDLEAAVRLMQTDGDEPDWRDYKAWKDRLELLVGWHAPDGSPQDSASWNVCHDHLLAVWEGRA